MTDSIVKQSVPGISRRWRLPATITRLGLAASLMAVSHTGLSATPASKTEQNSKEVRLSTPKDTDVFDTWWNGKQATGQWFGVRQDIEDHGLTFDGKWRGVFFGIADSQSGPGNAFTQELAFAAKLDFAKLTKLQTLDGLSAFGEVRWREPGGYANPNNIVLASPLFNPSRYAGGVGWRLMSFGLGYTTPELFGVEDFLSASAGWLQPQREFLEQPLARLFVNNAMASSEGLGANIPFGSSFTSWGATLGVKPSDLYYSKAGLFMSYPNPTSSNNNGLMFQGNASDPAENGLFFLSETGLTPKFGAAKLPGRYAFGAYYYGEDNPQFGTAKYGFYWQADQMLYREPSSKPDKLSEQGLRTFNLFVFAPDGWNNQYPFYFHSGLVYEGLIPSRDKDQLLFGIAFGEYSERQQARARNNRNRQTRRRQPLPEPQNTALLEAGYRIRPNGWSFIQPFAQYIVQPNGTTSVANATILGVFVGVDF